MAKKWDEKEAPVQMLPDPGLAIMLLILNSPAGGNKVKRTFAPNGRNQ